MWALLAGIFNSRLPQPKYCFLWSIQTVVDFIRKKWERNQELSDKFLIYKLTMLMALTSASHALGLQHLSIRFMAKTPIVLLSLSTSFTRHGRKENHHLLWFFIVLKEIAVCV